LVAFPKGKPIHLAAAVVVAERCFAT